MKAEIESYIGERGVVALESAKRWLSDHGSRAFAVETAYIGFLRDFAPTAKEMRSGFGKAPKVCALAWMDRLAHDMQNALQSSLVRNDLMVHTIEELNWMVARALRAAQDAAPGDVAQAADEKPVDSEAPPPAPAPDPVVVVKCPACGPSEGGAPVVLLSDLMTRRRNDTVTVMADPDLRVESPAEPEPSLPPPPVLVAEPSSPPPVSGAEAGPVPPAPDPQLVPSGAVTESEPPRMEPSPVPATVAPELPKRRRGRPTNAERQARLEMERNWAVEVAKRAEDLSKVEPDGDPLL